MKVFKIIISSLLFLCLLACSGTSSSTNPETDSEIDKTFPKISEQDVSLILAISENGGCMMMGPNCPRYALMSDGSFEVFRAQATEVVNSGKLDRQLVNQWLQVTADSDFKTLLSRLGEGECRACYDGVDLSYSVLPNSKNISINSNEYEFSLEEDFFMLSDAVHKAMRSAAPLEIQSR